MDYGYARPPPPPPSSMADPNYLQQPPRPPLHPPGPWYSGQFQYHHPPQHSPSPPPQWHPPPPHPQQQQQQQQYQDQIAPPSYHAPPQPPPYAANPMQQHTYPYSLPPRAPMLPPPPHSQVPQPYPPINQDWSNQSWGHQGWDYSVHSNEDDWASKAKAWAAGKAATETQHQQSQFTPVGRPEEPNHYHDHYVQNVDPQYADVQQQVHPGSSYQQYPPAVAATHGTPVADMQESSSFSSGYASNGYLPYPARGGTLAGDSAVGFPHQEPSPTNLPVHQQEVPSSYSSVAGNERAQEQNGKFYQSSHGPFTSAPQHHVPPVLMEQSHYAYGNQSAETTTDISDQPLEFTHRVSHDHDPPVQSSYTNESRVPAMPSNYSWTPPAGHGGVYSSISQIDPSGAIPHPNSAHSATLFGRMPEPNFQPTMSSVSPTFPIGTGNLYHATPTFSGETYGASGVPLHNKKALLPNWLREEVIKKKAAIGSSVPEFSKEDTKSNEDDGIDNSYGKRDQSDSKSVESSRSMEEEDDDEDYVEAARTAAINQEIKRVLTEVLLKVTDELFDEIATEVLTEDSLSVEVVEHDTVASNHTISPSRPSVPIPKASAKILIPAKRKETEVGDVNGKLTASSTGDVLGLGNYASDDDDNEEVDDDAKPSPKRGTLIQQPAGHKLTEATKLVNNEHSLNVLSKESDPHTINAVVAAREPIHVDRDDSNSKEVVDGSEVFNSKGVEKIASRIKLPKESSNIKKLVTDDSEGRTTRDGSNKSFSNKSSAGKESNKEVERLSRNGDENSRSPEERHTAGRSKDDRNGSKGKVKDRGTNSGEKAKEFNSKKSSHDDVRADYKETERSRRTRTKEDHDRTRERAKDEKGERRHKDASDSSRHKGLPSSSKISKDKSSKDKSTVSHANDSSDESSDDSRRKVHSKRRNLSPSPVRSRRRHVSRSPHSKHSQRRHSPYSSLESTRKRRSRSRSPVRRQK